jgi:hypothetical protein
MNGGERREERYKRRERSYEVTYMVRILVKKGNKFFN